MKVVKIVLIILVILVLLVGVGPFLVPVPALENTVSAESLADEDSLFVEVNGLKVHYKKMGQGQPVMILLHGFGASTFSWRDVMEPLAANGTVIAYDRPAFGLTERPMLWDWSGDSPYSAASQVDLLIGLMDNLEIQQAILIGNSAGGSVAVQTALEHPKRVQALVLVDAAIYGSGTISPWMIPFIQTPQMDHLGPLMARQIQKWGEEFLNRAWHDPSKISAEVREGYRKPLKITHWDRALWQITRAYQPSDLQNRLKDLNLPVFVITGDDDRIVPTDSSLRLAKEIPNAALNVIPSCGHVPQEEAPQEFLAAVLPWISTLWK